MSGVQVPLRPLVKLFAHRGDSAHYLENSMEAFAAAVSVADVLETDVRLNAEGRIVLVHDNVIDRIAVDSSGPVGAYTMDALRSFSYVKPGVPATLDELLDSFPTIPVNIDIKDRSEDLVKTLGETIASHGAQERTTVGSFHSESLDRFRSTFPGVRTSMHPEEVKRLLVASWTPVRFRNPGGACCAQVPLVHGGLPVTTRRMVDTAHRSGLEVHVWTVNSERDFGKCLRCGVDGIMSDDPTWARSALDREETAQ